MHYKSLTPLNFAPPLLYMEIGMGNQAWEHFEEWIDYIVEVSQKLLINHFMKLDAATGEKRRKKKSIEIQQKMLRLRC